MVSTIENNCAHIVRVHKDPLAHSWYWLIGYATGQEGVRNWDMQMSPILTPSLPTDKDTHILHIK